MIETVPELLNVYTHINIYMHVYVCTVHIHIDIHIHTHIQNLTSQQEVTRYTHTYLMYKNSDHCEV